jgi:2-polyprenyl-3-methyl-5-hydroxy-6-metoxy-1,4-benzoquinol methylase
VNWELVWNDIYEKQGEVQRDVLPTVEMIADLFQKENVKTVLDLGCGMGRHSIYLAKRGFSVTATDISPKGIEVTTQKAKREGLTIKTVCHDFRNIPFENDSFDAVLCVWTSGHGNKADMIKNANEMIRVVKPSGIVFVDYVSKQDSNYGLGTEIEKDTFINNTPGEEDIPHYYTDAEELSEIYSGHEHSIKPYTYSFHDDQNHTHHIEALLVVCKK